MDHQSFTTDWVFDATTSARGRSAWHGWDDPHMPWDRSSIYVDGAPVVEGDLGCAQPRFSPDGSRLAFLCDRTGWLNLWVADGDGGAARPLVEEPFEHGEPAWYEGLRSLAWSSDSRTIAFERNEEGFGRLVVVDVATGDTFERGKGVHRGLQWWDGGIAAVRSGARTPEQWIAVDPLTGDRAPIVTTASPVPVELLVEPEVVWWTSPDSVEIPGRLYRPGQPHGGLLVWIHGGPTGQSRVDWNRRVVGALAEGWTVLVPDHRGSTGWGRAFARALHGRWGEADVADTMAGVDHAVGEGWCDPDRVVVAGPSAGGFTVLHLLARHPGRFAAGVAWYPVSDLLATAATTVPFEAHYFDVLVPDGELVERSPLSDAESITDRLLVFHGADDPVVSVAQSHALAAVVPSCELVTYAGEGHGFRTEETRRDELERFGALLRDVSSR